MVDLTGFGHAYRRSVLSKPRFYGQVLKSIHIRPMRLKHQTETG